RTSASVHPLLMIYTDTPPTDIYPLSLHDALPIWTYPKISVDATAQSQAIEIRFTYPISPQRLWVCPERLRTVCTLQDGCWQDGRPPHRIPGLSNLLRRCLCRPRSR